MTNRKMPSRGKGEILEAIPLEYRPRDLVKILGVSRVAPRQWRDLGEGPAYREEDGNIIYDARSIATWLHHRKHGQHFLELLRPRD